MPMLRPALTLLSASLLTTPIFGASNWVTNWAIPAPNTLNPITGTTGSSTISLTYNTTNPEWENGTGHAPGDLLDGQNAAWLTNANGYTTPGSYTLATDGTQQFAEVDFAFSLDQTPYNFTIAAPGSSTWSIVENPLNLYTLDSTSQILTIQPPGAAFSDTESYAGRVSLQNLTGTSVTLNLGGSEVGLVDDGLHFAIAADFAPIPEPTTPLFLIGAALAGSFARRR